MWTRTDICKPLAILAFIAITTVQPSGAVHAQCPALFGDVDGSGGVNVTDVQCSILYALFDLGGGAGAPPVCAPSPDDADADCDEAVSVIDVQLIINAVLGVPIEASLDTDGSGCPDSCEGDCPGAGCGGDCCASHSGVGCDSSACVDCVCGEDAFCCETQWDFLCAGSAADECAAECPGCACGDGTCDSFESCVDCPADCGTCTGSCCQDNNSIGCQDSACQDCVCAADPFCCDSQWDGLCADAAADACVDSCPVCACAEGACVEDCCVATEDGEPGCGVSACEDCVCAVDPFCCNTEWDDLCADQTVSPCGESCQECNQCGDGECDAWEDCESCGLDCGPCTQPGSCVDSCGGSDPSGTCFCDSICIVTGDCCPDACTECADEFAPGVCPTCGDGVCSDFETCQSCPGDCGACVTPTSCAGVCGGSPAGGACSCEPDCFEDGECCFDVCVECSGQTGFAAGCSCGDGVCGASEDCESCPLDCGGCDGQTCTGRCGGVSEDQSCSCSPTCFEEDNCCADACTECASDFPDGFCPVCGDGDCHPLEAAGGGCGVDCGFGANDGPCKGRCGGPGAGGTCFCDASCFVLGDCCIDVCGSCAGEDPGVDEACFGCGDGVCAAGESCTSCPNDCGICEASCDKACGTVGLFCACDELCTSFGDCCFDLCKECPDHPECGSCGNGFCDGEENCGTCPGDCACPLGETCQGFVCTVPETVTVAGCPTVDVSLCRDADYLSTACGQQMLSEAMSSSSHPCREAFDTATDTNSAALDSKLVVSAPVTNSAGVTTEPAMSRALAKIEPSAGDDTSDALSALELLARFIWDANGDDITSCEEYAHERFAYYSEFDDIARGYGEDYRAIFNQAFGNVFLDFAVASQTLLQGNLFDKSGEPSPPLPQPTTASPKNFYFDVSPVVQAVLESEAANWTEFGLGTVGPFGTPLVFFGPDPVLQAMLPGFDPAEQTVKDLQWHQDMSDLLTYNPVFATGFLDEELNLRFDHQLEYLRLVETFETKLFAWGTRQSACAAGNLANGGISGPVGELIEEIQIITTPESELERAREEFAAKCTVTAMTELEAEADAAWAAVRAHLKEAQDLGCFAAGVSPCDWSPKLFSHQYRGALDDAKEQAKLACQEWSPVPFYSLSNYSFPLVGDMTAAEFPQNTNFLDSSLDLQSFAAIQQAYTERVVEELAQLLGLPPEDEDPFGLSQGESESKTLGRDEYFSVGYSYEAAWNVYGIDNVACNLNASFDGEVSAGFTILDTPFEVVSAEAVVDGIVDQGDDNAGGFVRIEVADNVLANPPTTETLFEETYDGWDAPNFTLVDDTWSDTSTAEFSGPTFPILGVPIRLGAGFSGTFDTSALIRVESEFGCTPDFGLRLASEFTPSLGFSGFVTVSIDYVIIEAGVKGEVTLIELELPTSVDLAATAPNGDLNDLQLTATVTADARLRTLDGRIKLFAEVLFETFEKTIFRWEGLSRSFRLFEAEFGVPVRVLDFACSLDLIDC